MKKLLSNFVVAISMAAALLPVSIAAGAERMQRIVVPAPPGTAVDVMARLLAEHMGEGLGTSFVVENRPGASGVIAVEAVLATGAAAPALLVGGLDHLLYGPAMLGRKPWDPLADVKLVGLVNNDRWVVIGSLAIARDLAGLVRVAEKRPLRCANTGQGSTQHSVCAWVAKRLAVAVEHISYKQPFMPDLIGGRVDIATVPVPGAAAALNAHQVAGIMLLSRDRHPSFPTVPTAVELGAPGLFFEAGVALFAAPSAAEADIDRWHEALQRAQADATVQKRFVDLGVEPAPATRAEAAQRLRERIRLNDEIRMETFGRSR